jgi:predicted nucleotidyltransferase
LERLALVNAPDAPYAYRVKTVVMFGSYATAAAQVGDVDLAVELEPRHRPGSPEQEALKKSRYEITTRPRFSNIVDQIFWPKHEVIRVLKAKASTLSVHDLDELNSLQPAPPYVVVLGEWRPRTATATSRV